MSTRPGLGLALAFVGSVGAHGVAYGSLSGQHVEELRPAEISEMNFELPPLPTNAPDPQAAAERSTAEPAPAPPSLARRALASKQATSRTVAPSHAAPSTAPALDLSGVTLTNDSGADFAMPTGDGSALRGPIGLGANRVPSVAPSPATRSATQAPHLVAVSDLSERPRPPSLAGLLRANYPEEARLRGLRGSARLRARIDSDGVSRAVWVLSETSAGFGSACQRTVLGSRWSVPRDKRGGAVATEIVYTCHFEVDP